MRVYLRFEPRCSSLIGQSFSHTPKKMEPQPPPSPEGVVLKSEEELLLRVTHLSRYDKSIRQEVETRLALMIRADLSYRILVR